jgi:hypothetical protein
MEWIVATILWLAPQLGDATARQYARLIDTETRRQRADPALVVAIVHLESSWNRRSRSRTRDYGLMQVHVSDRPGDAYRGREHLLLDPRVNIRAGVRVLSMWRRYHARACGPHSAHPYWAHYRSGYRATVTDWERRIGELRAKLKRRREEQPRQIAMGD